jgi:enoyl-CoA hydratase
MGRAASTPAMSEAPAEPEVLTFVEGRVGRISLNRPRALNALNPEMIAEMTRALIAWRDDPAVELVLLDHAGPKGFCAGGDIRRIVSLLESEPKGVSDFFFHEYRLNTLMNGYAKPIVALMDGIVMGGGAGIALPARYRVATERTNFAMPETAIGLFPDVGSGWRLPRMPGRLGWWLGLVGGRIGPADCLLNGIATDYVDSARVVELKATIVARPGEIERILTEFQSDAGRPPLAEHQDLIARAFDQTSVEAVIAALEADGGVWGREQLDLLAARSPQSLKVAFRLLEQGAKAGSFAEDMVMEHALAVRVTARPDFREGVRAVVIDKDNQPRWEPATLEGVTEALLADIFQPLTSAEAWTPLPSP